MLLSKTCIDIHAILQQVRVQTFSKRLELEVSMSSPPSASMPQPPPLCGERWSAAPYQWPSQQCHLQYEPAYIMQCAHILYYYEKLTTSPVAE